MEIFEVIINEECSDFNGIRKFFSSYDKVKDFIFKRPNRKFYFRRTNIEETPDTFAQKLNDRQYETIRIKDYNDNDVLTVFPNMILKNTYYHVLKVKVN